MAYRLGVDVGGTFTDLFLVEDSEHRQWRVKTPSTPSDPSQGVLKGVSRICEESGEHPVYVKFATPPRVSQRRRVQGNDVRPCVLYDLRPAELAKGIE